MRAATIPRTLGFRLKRHPTGAANLFYSHDILLITNNTRKPLSVLQCIILNMGTSKTWPSAFATGFRHFHATSKVGTSGTEVFGCAERQSDGAKPEFIHDDRVQLDRYTASLPTPPASPTLLLCFKGDEVEREETEDTEEELSCNKPQRKAGFYIDVESLKLNLLLDTMRCRCPTSKGSPCTRSIPTSDHMGAQALLRMLNRRNLPLERLVECLESLVSLVHCFQHNSRFAKESRLSTWISFIVRPSGAPKPAQLVSRDIARALDLSGRCIGLTKSDARCKRSIGGQRVHNCRRTLERLVDPEVYYNEAFVDAFLKVMEANRYCDIHIKQDQTKLRGSWKSAIGMARDDPFVTADGCENFLVGQRSSSLGHGNSDLECTAARSRTLRTFSSPTTTHAASIDAAAFWPEASDVSPWTIRGRSHQLRTVTRGSSVKSVARKPLDKEEQKTGWVYIYRVQGNPKLLKIGYTSRPVVERHREWEFDCNRNVLPVYPLNSDFHGRIENARRVEAMCHAELENCRVWVYCENCMKDHNEWFDVPADRAVSVVQKWSSWMNARPYHGARLKKEEEERVRQGKL